MKKLFSISVAMVFACGISTGQTSGTVSLKVSDQMNKPQEGVFVQLMNAKDSTMAKYSVTDEKGNVEFRDVAKGKYIAFISQTGFENYFSPIFAIDSIHWQITLPEVVLKAKELKEVVVTTKIPTIQHFADKTVVNVQESLLSSAGTAYDVLQRSPGVMIDQNDNISLNGKQGIMVMIDGRITPMSASDIANLLKSMPAESIDKIEFITNPSAKYDANGSAGIINIVLKKDKRMGLNANVFGGYTQSIYPNTSDGFSFNDRTKKMNIFGSYNYAYRGSSNSINLRTNFYNGTEFAGGTEQYEYLKAPTADNTARFGIDYFLSDKTTIGFIADGSIEQFKTTETTTTYVDSADGEKSFNQTSSYSPNTINNYAGNLNLKHVFDSAGRELLVNVDYANYNNNSYQTINTDYYTMQNYESGSPTALYGYLPGMLNIYSLKADYDGVLDNKSTLQVGVKTSYVKTDNAVYFYNGANSSAPVDTTQTNHFIYSENINAAYISYGRTIPKALLQFGIRAEQTVADGNQVTTGQTFFKNYTQLFPNFSIDDSLTANQQLDFSATRRIDRPTYDQLNPFSLYINPNFYLRGNPLLQPQNAYTFQLTDTYLQKYSIDITYTHTIAPITKVIVPIAGTQDIVQQTDDNLTSSDYYGVNLTAATSVTKWWNTTTSGSAYYNTFNGDISSTPLNSTRFIVTANSNNMFTISKKVSADISGWYISGADYGYLWIGQMGALSAGMQVKILDGRCTVKLSAYDILWTQLTNAVTSFTGYDEYIFVRRDTRMVGLNFSYHFGGNSTSQSLHSRGGAEDEKKRAGGTA